MALANFWYYIFHLPVSVLGIGLWKLILYVSAPLALVKMFISMVHLYVAMHNIASLDYAEREQAKQESSAGKETKED